MGRKAYLTKLVRPGTYRRKTVRWAKRKASRFFRRLAKRDPENAPRKRFYDGADDN